MTAADSHFSAVAMIFWQSSMVRYTNTFLQLSAPGIGGIQADEPVAITMKS